MAEPAHRRVKEELTKWVKLRDLLSADEPDPAAILDTLEGETDLHEALAEVAKSAKEDEALAKGLALYIAELTERKSRMETTAERKRNLLIMAMEKASLANVRRPEITITLKPVPPKLVVNDEAKVPAEFFKVPDPVIDRASLKAALEAGTIIDGASLSNGGVTVQLRSK